MYKIEFVARGDDDWTQLMKTPVDTVTEAVIIATEKIASHYSLYGVLLRDNDCATYMVYLADQHIGYCRITKI